MKYSRLSLAMIALLATQTVTQADDMDRDRGDKKPARTWRQAAYDNRYGLVAGSAAVGLGALGYVYGGDFMTWYNSLSSEDQTKAQDVLEKSVEKDLQVIEEKQGVVADKIDAKKNSAAQQKAIAREEQAIAQAQKQVAQKQTWLQWMMGKGTGYVSENPEEKSSDDFHSDREVEDAKKSWYAQKEDESANQYEQSLRDNGFLDKLSDSDQEIDSKTKLLQKSISSDNPRRVSKILSGDFSDVTNSEAYKNASVAGQNLVDRMDDGIKSGLNNAGQTASDAYNKVAAYFTPAPAAESPAKDTSSNLTGADVEGFSTLGDGDRDESL